MTKKKLSNEAKEFIHEVHNCIEILQKDRAIIDAELDAGNEKLKAFIESIFPWSGLYSLPLSLIALIRSGLGLPM